MIDLKKPLLSTVLISSLAVTLIGCSNPTIGPSSEPAESENTPAQAVTEIIWEDLMPEGEDELLEALFVEFYKNFETEALSNSLTLAEAAAQENDFSAVIVEGSAEDTMEQIGTFNVVSDLNGEHIRIPGYVVPFDFNAEGKHTEFLLVPYFGACLHPPPPPPNQIILVKSKTPTKIARFLNFGTLHLAMSALSLSSKLTR